MCGGCVPLGDALVYIYTYIWLQEVDGGVVSAEEGGAEAFDDTEDPSTGILSKVGFGNYKKFCGGLFVLTIILNLRNNSK